MLQLEHLLKLKKSKHLSYFYAASEAAGDGLVMFKLIEYVKF